MDTQTQCRQTVVRYTLRSWRVPLCDRSHILVVSPCADVPHHPVHPPRPLSGSVTQETITVTTLLAVYWDLGER